MEFDKSVGIWNLEDSTSLDDIAYSLMIKKGNYVNQTFFKHHKGYSPYYTYYEKAEIILRNEKLKKIINNISNGI